MVSDPESNLKFIEIPLSAIVDDVLIIPDVVIEKGIIRLRSAIVSQFLGTPPPFRKGIKPIDFAPRATLEWIEFQGVPPEVIANEGISWLSSKIGKPLNKFVRDRVNVRVCLLRDRAVPCPEKVKIDLSEDERYEIQIVQPKAREYGKPSIQECGG
ncbi:hypothetical protein LINPERPRIM_LOCUS38472 [Linum perenne]